MIGVKNSIMSKNLSTQQMPRVSDLGERGREAVIIPLEQLSPLAAFLDSEKTSNLGKETLTRHFQDTYLGEFANQEDYARAYLQETGELDKVPKHLRDFFDYFLYARELFSTRVYDLKSASGIYVFYAHEPQEEYETRCLAERMGAVDENASIWL
jgi:hypothetical protein